MRLDLPLDQVLIGDCRDVLATLPDKSVDLIFADPPYNLQLQQELWRPNMTRVDGVDAAWDQFADFARNAEDRRPTQGLGESGDARRHLGSAAGGFGV